MNRRTIDHIIVAVIGGLILLAAVVLFVARADAAKFPEGPSLKNCHADCVNGYCYSVAICDIEPAPVVFGIVATHPVLIIPEPKFDASQPDWRPKSAVLDDGNYEITYPEKIIHEGKELSGQVCREGKSIAISASKNKTRGQVQAEIITQIFKLTGEDSETMVRFVEHNRKLVDFLLELSVTEMLK